MKAFVLHEEQLTRSVIGAFYRTYTNLGYGFLESVYTGALVVELRSLGHIVEREVAIPVRYQGVDLGVFRADLVVDGKLIVEVKADSEFTAGPERQLLNYLRCSGLEVGLLLVFGIKPRFKRVVNTKNRQVKQVKTNQVNP